MNDRPDPLHRFRKRMGDNDAEKAVQAKISDLASMLFPIEEPSHFPRLSLGWRWSAGLLALIHVGIAAKLEATRPFEMLTSTTVAGILVLIAASQKAADWRPHNALTTYLRQKRRADRDG